jgi:hypothetical protein
MSHRIAAGKFFLRNVLLTAGTMGDIERLARCVTERAAGLTLYARQFVDDAASAEDVVQEALTSLLAQRPPPAGSDRLDVSRRPECRDRPGPIDIESPAA